MYQAYLLDPESFPLILRDHPKQKRLTNYDDVEPPNYISVDLC